MVAKFKIEQGQFGKRMVLKTRWSEKIRKYFLENNIKELELNRAKGWIGNDISFVNDLKELLAVDIIKYTISDVSAIHGLSKLRRLKIFTYCKTELDFSCFPELEDISLYWRTKAKSIFDCFSLKRVFIDHYVGKEKNLTPFSKLKNLEYLSLKTPRINEIGNIEDLINLTFLGIYNVRKLSSLSGIEKSKNLKVLEIQACRSIRRIDEIAELVNLERLLLCDDGEIENLKPISKLQHLKEFYFYESTNIIDGDLSPVSLLPNLKNVSFQNRRHYNLKREYLWEKLGCNL